MKIKVSGSIEIGQNLPKYIEEKFEKEAVKFFEDIPYAEVHLKKPAQFIHTTILVKDVLKKGSKINAEADGEDAYKSFDEAFKKLLTQLRKEKDKVVTEKRRVKKIQTEC